MDRDVYDALGTGDGGGPPPRGPDAGGREGVPRAWGKIKKISKFACDLRSQANKTEKPGDSWCFCLRPSPEVAGKNPWKSNVS